MKTNINFKELVSETLSTEQLINNKFWPKTITSPIKRTKLWELNNKHHCPIIGVCLSVNDLLKFSRRFGFTASQCDEYSLHIEAVGKVTTRNPVSKAVQKYLDNKYQNTINHFNKAKSDSEVRALWEDFYIQGKGSSAMWASLTHKSVSEETRDMIYARMHMHAHQAGAAQAADLRKLNQLEMENEEIKFALEQQQQRYASKEAKWRQRLDKATKSLECQVQLQNEMANIQSRINALESGVAMTEMGRRLMELTTENEQLRATAKRVETLKETLEATCREAMKLVQERDSLSAQRDLLEQLLQADIDEEDNSENKPVACDAESSRSGRVLCVGGRVSLLPQYREVAKQFGIRLIHHDGGQQEAMTRLPDLIDRANAVVCPTDCVSHAAYYLLKRHCKRSRKPCLLFKGSSVSSFAKALSNFFSNNINPTERMIRTIHQPAKT